MQCTAEIIFQISTLHHEKILFLVITTATYPIILRFPWMRPHISWIEKETIYLKVPSVLVAPTQNGVQSENCIYLSRVQQSVQQDQG